jgi:SNF2 family DNA or RNA helicase
MNGLVLVKFKKDCLDLPEKQYEVIRVKPDPQTIRALNLIKSTSTRAVTALIRARTLSDGFQYTEEKIGEETCFTCKGEGKTMSFVPTDLPEDADSFAKETADYVEETIKCPECGGKGLTPIYARARDDCKSPKDDALIDLMEDQFEQYGRVVIWAGFSGSIDKLIDLCHKHKWATLRYDAKVEGASPEGGYLDKEMLLDALDASHPKYTDLLRQHPKIAFIGNPRAGGMGLTLTASPGAIYYSNDFSGEARIQSEDRVHRAGMDKNRACVIYDLIHLPTDMLVLENLQEKRNLQAMTMGELSAAMS